MAGAGPPGTGSTLPEKLFTWFKLLAAVAAGAATVLVFLDLLGVANIFGDGPGATQERSGGLPGEYLYLDDERVDAYLGQLRTGIAPSRTRSTTTTGKRESKLGASDVAQIGASFEQQQTITEP